MCPLSSKKPWQKRIMGRWKRRQEKGTCWLPRWNVHRKQKTAISIQFNGVFSPIHNWKCVYCFIFPLWEGATNLILHIESKLMVRIMHPLTLFLSQRMGQSEFPGYPRLCKQTPRILVPSGYCWSRTAGDVAQSTTTLKLKWGHVKAPGTLHPNAFHLSGTLQAVYLPSTLQCSQAPLPTHCKWGYWDKGIPPAMWISPFQGRSGKVPNHEEFANPLLTFCCSGGPQAWKPIRTTGEAPPPSKIKSIRAFGGQTRHL